MRYKVTNSFGSVIVERDQALEVWKSWPAERRGGNPEYGFVVWDVFSETGQVMMSTSYLPVADDAEP